MIKMPHDLKPGQTIGIVCPAGHMSMERAQKCIDTLHDWGYATRIGKTLGAESSNYFSGTDKARLKDFQLMLDDDGIDAVLCARGGYGIGRIIDDIDFTRFQAKPKWLIGFSDVTVLHAHIYSNLRIATLHAPMAGAFAEAGDLDPSIRSLRTALEGKKIKYQIAPHPLNKKGSAIGELVGGNLSLLAHLSGTASDIKTKGRILFLEDVGEYLYNIDRMLYQLKRNGKFEKLAGLVIGGFTELKDTPRPFGKTVYDIFKDLLKEYDFPVCYNFPVSHGSENYALKHGNGYKLKVAKTMVTLEE